MYDYDPSVAYVSQAPQNVFWKLYAYRSRRLPRPYMKRMRFVTSRTPKASVYCCMWNGIAYLIFHPKTSQVFSNLFCYTFRDIDHGEHASSILRKLSRMTMFEEPYLYPGNCPTIQEVGRRPPTRRPERVMDSRPGFSNKRLYPNQILILFARLIACGPRLVPLRVFVHREDALS